MRPPPRKDHGILARIFHTEVGAGRSAASISLAKIFFSVRGGDNPVQAVTICKIALERSAWAGERAASGHTSSTT